MKLKINIPDWNNCSTASISVVDGEKDSPLKNILGVHFSINATKMNPKILLDIDLEQYESIIDSNNVILVDQDGTKYYVSKIEVQE